MSLDPLAVELVQRLLAQTDLSHRKIALQTGVSRGSVTVIKQGKWRAPRPRRDNPDLLFVAPTGPASRCPICGALVYGICHACRVRREKLFKGHPFPDNGEESTEPNTLDLKPDEHARYLEVRRRRAQAQAQ